MFCKVTTGDFVKQQAQERVFSAEKVAFLQTFVAWTFIWADPGYKRVALTDVNDAIVVSSEQDAGSEGIFTAMDATQGPCDISYQDW